MGASLSWLAIKGRPACEILTALELARTDETITELNRGGPWCARLPPDWYLIVLKGCDHVLLKPQSLAAISAGAELVAASVEEHVMVCASESWRDGRQLWKVTHDAQQADDHLEVAGAPPEQFGALRAAQEKLAGEDGDEVDHHFEIPLLLARSVTGFKHDEHEVAAATVLVSTRKPFWKFW
jgi:hypothetical protein